MKMEEKEIGKNSARIAVLLALIAIVVAAFSVLPAIVSAAQGVEVRVNAPEYVAGTFNATIDVDNVTDLNSGQFDLSFNSSVVNVTEVKEGEIDGDEVPIFMCDDVSANSVMVFIMMSIGDGVSGSRYLAEIKFKVEGKAGEGSKLSLSNGVLTGLKKREGLEELELEDIPTNWIDAEIQIGVEEKDDEEDEEEVEEVGKEVTPVSSNITAWKPAEAVVNDTVGESRTFNISGGQILDIRWQINGTEVQTNESVTEASVSPT